jgi:predicted N-acetyltransferase YhbS
MTRLRKTPFALSTDVAPLSIRAEHAGDVPARETLLDACFGTSRASRTCQRLRDGHAPAEPRAFRRAGG